jgi:hypothetical protein
MKHKITFKRVVEFIVEVEVESEDAQKALQEVIDGEHCHIEVEIFNKIISETEYKVDQEGENK